MKIIIWFLLFIVISCSNNPKSDFQKLNPDFDSKLNNKISSIYKDLNIYGDFLIGVVNENGLVYSCAMNKDILSGKTSTLDANSPVYIASHTKSFTGTLLKILEEEGKIDLNKTLYDYLPEITFDGSINTKSITVRQMLNHTLGFTSSAFIWKTAYLGYTRGNEELIESINTSFRYDPSHQFRYSNTGPILAAMIVEKVTGKSWKEEMQDRIFQPLNMGSTSSNVTDFKMNEIRPSIRMSNENDVFSSGFYKQNITMSAAGGTISTINDLAKWLRFNLNQETSIIKKQVSFDELHGETTRQDRTYFTYKRHGYSLGWDIATYQADTILTRFGSYGGISFHLSFIPSQKIGMIAFSNQDGVNQLPHLLANYAYNLIAKRPDVEEIFDSESKSFIELYERIRKDPLPSEDMLIESSDTEDLLIGMYKNVYGWPDISIKKDGLHYKFTWGILSGSVYKMPDPDRPYLSSLGPVMRTFNVHKKNGVVDSLFTGSLKYIKTK